MCTPSHLFGVRKTIAPRRTVAVKREISRFHATLEYNHQDLRRLQEATSSGLGSTGSEFFTAPPFPGGPGFIEPVERSVRNDHLVMENATGGKITEVVGIRLGNAPDNVEG